MITYYSVANIAERVGVTAQRAYNWYDRGLFPEPTAKTVTGRPLWNEESAMDAITIGRTMADRHKNGVRGRKAS